MKYKCLTLILENCDQIYLDPKDVVFLNVSNLTTNVRIENGEVSRWYKASKLDLTILASANVEVDRFGSKYKVFDRLLSYPDITSIIIEYEDGSSEQIFVEWEDLTPNGCDNKYQESVMVGDNLLIAISPTHKKDIEDILDEGLDFYLENINLEADASYF